MESGEDLCRAAEKKLRGGGFLSFLTGGPNYDEAADLYSQAANRFKIQKNWQKATECFQQAAHIYEKAGDQTRYASSLMEAGHTAKKFSASEAAKHYNHAVEAYNRSGRFGQSAKTMKNIAEIYEGEGDQLSAMQYYKKAAEYFDMDEYGKSQYTACILKYAEATAQLENNYAEAIKIFETEGEKALRNPLIQYGAKEHFLKAGILRLVQGDVVDMKIALERYEDMDPRFASSREGRLLRSLVTAFEEQDEDVFVTAIQEFDNITRLDSWRVHFLYKVRDEFKGKSTGAAAVHSLAANFDEDKSDGEVDLT